MSKCIRSRNSGKSANGKPPKPYAEFPLGPHNNGRWQKRINGQLYYFGRWGRVVNGKLERIEGDGWKEALDLYKAQIDDIQAGRKPRPKGDAGLTVMDLCNRFLTAKKRQLEAGEITGRTFAEYNGTTDRLFAAFGKTRQVDDLGADDFEALRAEVAKSWGPHRLANEVQRVRTVFKYAFESGLIEKPVRFGPQFVKPSKTVMRKHRAARGQRLFAAEQLRSMIDAAGVPLKAMILLGINCGFGNSDCGTLPLSAVDLDGGWIRYPRPKTGIERRCPLWPETVAAIRAALADRPSPKDSANADTVFITKYGQAWANGGASDAVTLETGKLLRRPRCPVCGKINGVGAESCACEWKPSEKQPWARLHRTGLGQYALRHTFRTIADATRDFPAVRLIMGHADGSIDDVYREHIDDSRLQAVVDHVRAWLFPAAKRVEAPRPSAWSGRISRYG